MQKLQSSTLDRLDQQTHDGLIAAPLEESGFQSVSLLKRIEIWVGRLAMFGLTTIIAAIAINVH